MSAKVSTISEALPILRARLQEIIDLDGKATPGNWRVRDVERKMHSRGRVLMEFEGYSIGHIGENTEAENESNASLIALLRNSTGMARVMLVWLDNQNWERASCHYEPMSVALIALAEEWRNL